MELQKYIEKLNLKYSDARDIEDMIYRSIWYALLGNDPHSHRTKKYIQQNPENYITALTIKYLFTNIPYSKISEEFWISNSRANDIVSARLRKMKRILNNNSIELLSEKFRKQYDFYVDGKQITPSKELERKLLNSKELAILNYLEDRILEIPLYFVEESAKLKKEFEKILQAGDMNGLNKLIENPKLPQYMKEKLQKIKEIGLKGYLAYKLAYRSGKIITYY